MNHSHLLNLWADLQSPDFYWQFLVLGVSPVLAWALARLLHKRFSGAQDRLGLLEALVGQSFPLLTALFLSMAKGMMMGRLPVTGFDIAIPL
ncbi:MAG: hypothetical protein LBB55_00975, partial [Zoogloeaceae bacterium]|nr:hypothetical protein [Zoogloeaceae bacterium]